MEQRLDFYKANGPAIKAMIGLEERIGKSALEKSLVELVRLRASQINGCAFCVDMHTTDARKGGETERRLATTVVWRETPFFTDRERAALEWTEALTLVSVEHVPDAVWDTVRPWFNDEELVDLTLLVIAINGWNRMAIGFRKMPA
jgi:AhpD family alkylhydroperoxidase